MSVHERWGNGFVGVSGAVVPLFTTAASAPWRPSRAGTGSLPRGPGVYPVVWLTAAQCSWGC